MNVHFWWKDIHTQLLMERYTWHHGRIGKIYLAVKQKEKKHLFNLIPILECQCLPATFSRLITLCFGLVNMKIIGVGLWIAIGVIWMIWMNDWMERLFYPMTEEFENVFSRDCYILLRFLKIYNKQTNQQTSSIMLEFLKIFISKWIMYNFVFGLGFTFTMSFISKEISHMRPVAFFWCNQ